MMIETLTENSHGFAKMKLWAPIKKDTQHAIDMSKKIYFFFLWAVIVLWKVNIDA